MPFVVNALRAYLGDFRNDRSSGQQRLHHHPRGVAEEVGHPAGDEVRGDRRWDFDYPDPDH